MGPRRTAPQEPKDAHTRPKVDERNFRRRRREESSSYSDDDMEMDIASSEL